jgi:hypothetical protein
VKNILTGAIILIFISLHANGQQAQDTLYLKNGYKAVGKLLGESKKECRFKTSEGIYFTFSPGEVEKIVIAPKMIMRLVNPDTLNIDQLNLYMGKAVKMRNSGRALTVTGLGVMATGIVSGAIMLNNVKPHGPPEDPHGSMLGYVVIGLSGMIGIPCTLVGVPLWAVGGSRKTKAELSLQKFNIAPENSTALGLGITIRF